MKTRIFLISLFIICFGVKLHAQNWRGVSSTKSNYFYLGYKDTVFGEPNIKYIEITNKTPINPNDTLFQFYFTFRDSSIYGVFDPAGCVDTVAPSWLGSKVYRNETSGIEKYANFMSENMYINTFANLGDSWTLASGANNRSIIASITNVGTLSINGVLDSFKTITLNALQNGLTTNAYYNNFSFILSKNNGWQKIAELYLLATDTNHAFRSNIFNCLSSDSVNMLRSYNNLNRRFKAGNEWQYFSWRYEHGCYVRDSIISSSPLTNNSYLVTLKREHYLLPFYHMGYLAYGNTLTDTIMSNIIVDSTFSSIRDHFASVFYGFGHYHANSELFKPEHASLKAEYHFEVDTFVKPFLSTKYTYNQNFINTLDTTCFRFDIGTLGPAIREIATWNNLIGVTSYSFDDIAQHLPDTYFYLTYAKIDSLKYGLRIGNWTPNNINYKNQTPYAIHPNPTKNTIHINAPQNIITNIQIYSLDNKLLLNIIKPNNEVDLSTFNSGIYFLKLSTANNTYTQKIIKE